MKSALLSAKKAKNLPKLSGYMKEKHRRYPLYRQNRDNMTDAMVEPSSRGERTAPAPSGHLPMSEPPTNRGKKTNTACCRDNKP